MIRALYAGNIIDINAFLSRCPRCYKALTFAKSSIFFIHPAAVFETHSLQLICGVYNTQWSGQLQLPQRVPFVQYFFKHKVAISHSDLAIWSLIITNFFASQRVFLCQFTGPFILGSLFFCLAVVVPGCPLFLLFAAKAHLLHILACLLHIFRMSVEHFPNFLRIFLCIEMIFFFLHCAPKPQAVVVTISHFISRRRVSYFMLFICLITLNIFGVCCNSMSR